MKSLDAVCSSLAALAPLQLAESWDNVGLLVGDRKQSVSRIMTCLTISPGVVDEAIDQQADLIVAHHPLPFKALQTITSDTVAGSMLLRLIAGGVAIYSAHTAFDSAAGGINQMWAQQLGLESIETLVETEPQTGHDGEGPGRVGVLPEPESLAELIRRAASAVSASAPRYVGSAEQPVTKVALACGSGGSFLAAARRRGCDAMITGEATFHTCLEAESLGIGLGLLGHYASERFAMEQMARSLAETFPEMTIWPSQNEADPIAGL